MKKQRTTGFTLIEVLVIIPVVILIVVVFIAAIVAVTGSSLKTRMSNQLVYELQDTLNTMEQDIKLSSGFLSTNSSDTQSTTLSLQSPQGINDGGAAFNNVGLNYPDTSSPVNPTLILLAHATNKNPQDPSRALVYLANQPNACAATTVTQNTPLAYNVVYYINNDALWRRVIMPSNYATSGVACSSPWQQPSCSPGQTSSFCKTDDSELLNGIDSVRYTYLSGPGDPTSSSLTSFNSAATNTGNNAASRQTALNSISTVYVTITAHKQAAGDTISQTVTMQATKLNN